MRRPSKKKQRSRKPTVKSAVKEAKSLIQKMELLERQHGGVVEFFPKEKL